MGHLLSQRSAFPLPLKAWTTKKSVSVYHADWEK